MARTPVRFGRLALVLMALLAAAMLAGRAAAGTEEIARPERYVVAPGDTLWEIAVARMVPGSDPRPIVEEIRDRNGLGSPALRPGQVLVLPAG